MPSSLTHDQLVQRAVRWLRQPAHGRYANGQYWRRSGCGVVVPEYHSWTAEIADAFGMAHGGYSCAIECKVSRGDLLRDRRKPKHQGHDSLGFEQLYLAPEGIIRPGDLPERFGVLELQGPRNKLVLVRPPMPNTDRDVIAEIEVCYSLLRRAHVHGHLQDYLSPKWGGKRPPAL